MIEWIDRLFGGRSAAQRGRDNPVLQAAVQESAVLYNRIPLKEFIDEDRRAELARKLFLEINRICNTRDPVTACREHLAEAMLKLAAYQVLVIPPSPEEDTSGLRDQPGVSGELKERLVEICARNDDLRSTMFEESDSEDFDDLWGIVQRLYWETGWLLGTLNATRIALGDSVEGDDWYEPFLHAVCVELEHAYRWELEMPPAFDEVIAKEAATAYSVFTDIVLSGTKDPAVEWRDYCRGSGVPLPDFKR